MIKQFFCLTIVLCVLQIDAAQYKKAEKQQEVIPVRWFQKMALEAMKSNLDLTKEELENQQDAYDPRLKKIHGPVNEHKHNYAHQFGLQIIPHNSKRAWLVVDTSPDKSGYKKVCAELAKMEEEDKLAG